MKLRACALTALLILGTTGCSVLRLGETLPAAIADQSDPALVEEGLPSYLLLLDALILADPKNDRLLAAGAELHATYAAAFVEDPERASVLADRAWDYGRRSICSGIPRFCGFESLRLDEIEDRLPRLRAKDLKLLEPFVVAWLVSIRSHSSDWAAVGDLPKTEALLNRMIELDEDWDEGVLHLYLGILGSLRPPALGGDPEAARLHFERSIEMSGGRNLAAKVEFAAGYARLLYDRELHDQLLREVLGASPEAPGRTLSNVLAQRRARVLLATADDYF